MSQLREGLTGRVPPVKTINLVSDQVSGRPVSETVALAALPPGFKVQLRVQETTAAYRHLLPVSKRHVTTFVDDVTPEQQEQFYDIKAEEFGYQLALEAGEY